MAKDLAVYRDVCDGRFKSVENQLQDLKKDVHEIHAIVTNGLVDKVKTTQRLSWVVIGLMAGFITTQVVLFNMIAKYVKP
ncbi:MAG: hypothetical protein QGG64_10070 [Candidatus Latescibacteria bacterium]|jgi:hypothetical protein|nr:hypothetical protein [Candidatus Latescibacterota bacterium]